MFVKIYGRAGCPFCIRAENLAEKLKNSVDGFDYQYTDINKAGITKDDLSVLAGKTVTTVPQIFIDEKHIGGYTDFEALMGEKF